jgi:hypothetical protein
LQRHLPVTTGSFLEVEFQSLPVQQAMAGARRESMGEPLADFFIQQWRVILRQGQQVAARRQLRRQAIGSVQCIHIQSVQWHVQGASADAGKSSYFVVTSGTTGKGR